MIRIVGNNWVSRLLPWLAHKQTLLAPVYRPAPTPTPAPRILQFCVANPAQPAAAPSCQNAACTDCPPPVLALTRGEVETLVFSWRTEHLEGHTPELSPKTVTFTPDGTGATAPAPAGSITYTLTFVDGMGNRLPPLAVQVEVRTIVAQVTEPELYLRQSPGKVHGSLGILSAGTSVVLLTRPIDYQQNDDPLHWVLVTVQATGEQGWVACEGLNFGQLCSGQTAGDAGLVAALGTYVNAGDPIPQLSGGAATNQVASNSDLSAPIGGVADGPAGSLPVAMPTFGPTVTPTPTETPTPTPTPPPSATPTPTVEPLRVDIRVTPSTITNKECVVVEWNNVGVQAVYFNYGKDRDALEPVFDNRERSAQLCDKDYGQNLFKRSAAAAHSASCGCGR